MSLTPTTSIKPESSALFTSLPQRNAVVCLVLAVVTLALYNPVTHHPFVNYDDDRYVTENPHIRQGLTASTIKWAITSTEQANWHPLTWISHGLDYSLFRLNPAGHHFTSVVIHVINVVLLYLLLIWSTRRLGPSLFVAALFALHPINVESVAWIAERKNVLCTLFFLLTLWAYGWYARKPSWMRYLGVGALFAAGLACKPMVITLPCVLLLLDYWPLNRAEVSTNEPVIRWRQLVLEKLPLFLLSGASAVITLKAQRTGGALRSVTEFSFTVRIANAIHGYAMYLWKMLWPTRLAPLYPHPGNSLLIWRALLALLLLGAVSALIWRFRDRRYLPVGWLWFLGTLVPVIGLVQVGEAAMADRYAYIPLIGIFIMIAFGTAELMQQRNAGRWIVLPAAAILVALALITHRQLGYWESNVDLWSHTVAVTTNNFVAEDNLGGALILAGKEEEAYSHFAAAARINPRDPMSHSNLGTYFQNHNRLQEAVQQYQTAVTLTSDPTLLAPTYANLGRADLDLGDDQQALQNFERSLHYNAGQFNAWLGLGTLARKQGNLGGAISAIYRSLQIQPTASGYVELGRTLTLAGRDSEALAAFQAALRMEPGLIQAQQAIDALRRRQQ